MSVVLATTAIAVGAAFVAIVARTSKHSKRNGGDIGDGGYFTGESSGLNDHGSSVDCSSSGGDGGCDGGGGSD